MSAELGEEIAEAIELSEETIVGLGRNSATAHLVRDLAFSRFSAGMYPTLFDLQDELNALGRRGNIIRRPARVLRASCGPGCGMGNTVRLLMGRARLTLARVRCVPVNARKSFILT